MLGTAERRERPDVAERARPLEVVEDGLRHALTLVAGGKGLQQRQQLAGR